MLGPDVGAAKTILQASANAVATVTNYAQATLTAVPRIDNPPDWYAPIGADLVAAQGRAKGWIGAICPAVTTGLPNSISSFNDLFQSSTRQILALQDAIVADGGTPSADQRSSVDTLIGALSSAFAAQQANTNVIGQEVTGYSSAIKADQDKLGTDLGTVSARFASGGDWIQQITTAIGETFLQATQLGPCSAIVMIDMNISLKIGGINADPTVITLVLAKAIVENQLTNAPVAEAAVQAIVDFWGSLAAKAQAVASDLKNAADNRYIAILSEIDFKVAQTQWQQLADFAATLTNPSDPNPNGPDGP